MPSQCFLSVVIPAYNEEERLKKSLPPLREFLNKQDFTWEIVLVDDGSTDKTCEVPGLIFVDGEVKIVRNPGNRGKGYSLRQGVFAATGEIVLISDADFSSPVREWSKLYHHLEQGVDVAIGSRSLNESNVTVRQAWYREGMGRIFNFFVQTLVIKGFIDTQCGFKCFYREKALPVFSKLVVDRFSFDVEFLFVAQKHGLKVREVPVEWKNVLFSRVRIIRDSTQMLIDLFRIRLNAIRGIYD